MCTLSLENVTRYSYMYILNICDNIFELLRGNLNVNVFTFYVFIKNVNDLINTYI